MAARKPKIEYYWTQERMHPTTREIVGHGPASFVNWRLVGANGEILCQSTQGFRDKADAFRSVGSVIDALVGDWPTRALSAREVGPGRKPT